MVTLSTKQTLIKKTTITTNLQKKLLNIKCKKTVA